MFAWLVVVGFFFFSEVIIFDVEKVHSISNLKSSRVYSPEYLRLQGGDHGTKRDSAIKHNLIMICTCLYDSF